MINMGTQKIKIDYTAEDEYPRVMTCMIGALCANNDIEVEVEGKITPVPNAMILTAMCGFMAGYRTRYPDRPQIEMHTIDKMKDDTLAIDKHDPNKFDKICAFLRDAKEQNTNVKMTVVEDNGETGYITIDHNALEDFINILSHEGVD